MGSGICVFINYIYPAACDPNGSWQLLVFLRPSYIHVPTRQPRSHSDKTVLVTSGIWGAGERVALKVKRKEAIHNF